MAEQSTTHTHKPVEDYRKREVICSTCGAVMEPDTQEFRYRAGYEVDPAILSISHQVTDDIFIRSIGSDHKNRNGSTSAIWKLGKKKIKKQKEGIEDKDEEPAPVSEEKPKEDDSENEAIAEELGIEGQPEGTSYMQDAYNVGRLMEERGIFQWDEKRQEWKFAADYTCDKWYIGIMSYAFQVAANRKGRHLNAHQRGVLRQEVRKIYSRLILARSIIPKLVVEMAIYNAGLFSDDEEFQLENTMNLNAAIENLRTAVAEKCKTKKDIADSNYIRKSKSLITVQVRQ